MRKKLLGDVDGFIFDVSNVVILLWKYTGKSKITQGNHRENTGNFAFRDEWEPCVCTLHIDIITLILVNLDFGKNGILYPTSNPSARWAVYKYI